MALLNPKYLVDSLSKMEFCHERLKFLSGRSDELVIKDVGVGGVINKIYRIQSPNGEHSIVMKHGSKTPHAEVLSDLSIPLVRQEMEFNCLQTVHGILPGSVPEPYLLDKDLSIILMEDLGSMDLLNKRLRSGDFSLEVAACLGRVLSTVQCQTHRQVIDPKVWRLYLSKLRDTNLQDVYFRFRSDLMMMGERLLEVRDEWASQLQKWDAELKEKRIFERLKELFCREDCLIQYDMHHNAVFVKEGRVAIFDMEYGGIGNQAFSIGYILAFYVMSMVEVQEKDKEHRELTRSIAREAIYTLYSEFITGFGDHQNVLEPLGVFVSEMSAFMGQAMYSFILLVCHDMYFTIEASRRWKLAELGMKLMTEAAQITTFDHLMDTVYSHV